MRLLDAEEPVPKVTIIRTQNGPTCLPLVGPSCILYQIGFSDHLGFISRQEEAQLNWFPAITGGKFWIRMDGGFDLSTSGWFGK
jgi:hypothetical protein